MSKYLALLRQNRDFATLATIQLICYFGIWFSHTGVFTLLINLQATPSQISLAAAMAFLPSVVLAPFSGVLIDKFRAIPLFLIFMIIECVSVLMLLLIDSMSLFWLLLLLVFVRTGVASLYFQTEMSLLPKILSKDDLKLANEIHSIIWAFSYAAGMGLAGIYIHKFGVASSFIFDFCLYFIGTLLLFRLNLPNNVKTKTSKAITMIKEGLLYIKKSPLIMHLILIHAIIGVTAYDALVAIMAKYNYKEILSASLVIGFINMARAVPMVVAPMIIGKFANPKDLFWLFILQFVGVLAWSVLQFNFYLGFIGIFCAGFFISTLWSYTYTLIQTNCDKNYHGRVIAYVDMIFLLVATISSLGIGVLFDLGFKTSYITALIATVFLFGAFYYKFIYNRYLANE